MQLIVFIISVILILAFVYVANKKGKPLVQPAADTERKILQEHVPFYQRLSEEEKREFEWRVRSFLGKVRITGIETIVVDADRVFVAAGAIIPIFAFKNWEYRNINEVLLYPDSFNADFDIHGWGRDILGLVGNGPMQHVMILSQKALRNDFLDAHSTSNTAIHEFVHLVDKTDGDADGYPEALLPYKFSVPWLQRIHQEIQLIRAGRSDINPYGATNEAEFLAVAAEYFFKQPEMMEERHPDLYALLKGIFKPGKK